MCLCLCMRVRLQRCKVGVTFHWNSLPSSSERMLQGPKTTNTDPMRCCCHHNHNKCRFHKMCRKFNIITWFTVHARTQQLDMTVKPILWSPSSASKRISFISLLIHCLQSGKIQVCRHLKCEGDTHDLDRHDPCLVTRSALILKMGEKKVLCIQKFCDYCCSYLIFSN